MSSQVWSYFDKLPDEKSKCKKCKTVLFRKGGSTKSMWAHLQKCQKEAYEKSKGSTSKK